MIDYDHEATLLNQMVRRQKDDLGGKVRNPIPSETKSEKDTEISPEQERKLSEPEHNLDRNFQQKDDSFPRTIPSRVFLDPRLTWFSKALYAEILLKSQKQGFCWMKNASFSELFQVATYTISKSISTLEETGYVKIAYEKFRGKIQRKIYPLVDRNSQYVQDLNKDIQAPGQKPKQKQVTGAQKSARCTKMLVTGAQKSAGTNKNRSSKPSLNVLSSKQVTTLNNINEINKKNYYNKKEKSCSSFFFDFLEKNSELRKWLQERISLLVSDLEFHGFSDKEIITLFQKDSLYRIVGFLYQIERNSDMIRNPKAYFYACLRDRDAAPAADWYDIMMTWFPGQFWNKETSILNKKPHKFFDLVQEYFCGDMETFLRKY